MNKCEMRDCLREITELYVHDQITHAEFVRRLSDACGDYHEAMAEARLIDEAEGREKVS